MAERLKAPVLKIGRVQKALVGSNPTPSVFAYGIRCKTRTYSLL